MNAILQAALSGFLMGGVYAVIAIGLSLIFGVMKLVNFAHGDFLMAFMYMAWAVISTWKIDPYLAILIVAPLAFLAGYLFQRFLINGILRREKNTESPNIRLFTVGFAWLMANLALLLFGANPKYVNTAYTSKTLQLGGLIVSKPRLIAFVIGAVCALAIYIILYRTEMGRALRAISQNRFTARLMGINVESLYCIAFGMGIALVGISSCLLIPFYYIFPTVGSVFGLRSFVIVVLGGMGSIPGALLGGLIVGLIEAVGGQFLSPTYAEIMVFVAFIVVLLTKPKGLFSKA